VQGWASAPHPEAVPAPAVGEESDGDGEAEDVAEGLSVGLAEAVEDGEADSVAEGEEDGADDVGEAVAVDVVQSATCDEVDGWLVLEEPNDSQTPLALAHVPVTEPEPDGDWIFSQPADWPAVAPAQWTSKAYGPPAPLKVHMTGTVTVVPVRSGAAKVIVTGAIVADGDDQDPCWARPHDAEGARRTRRQAPSADSANDHRRRPVDTHETNPQP
jgi:hypothetical protein